MARRVRKARRGSPPNDDGSAAGPVGATEPENDPAVDALIATITTQPMEDWGIFSTGKPFTAQARKPDGNFRTVPLEGSEEFTFSGLRMGKRGKLIFEFNPVDPTYTRYEFDEEKVFVAVPALEEWMLKALGMETEVFDRPGEAWAAGSSRFRANFRRAKVVEEKKAEEEKLQKDADRMANNPLFGMF